MNDACISPKTWVWSLWLERKELVLLLNMGTRSMLIPKQPLFITAVLERNTCRKRPFCRRTSRSCRAKTCNTTASWEVSSFTYFVTSLLHNWNFVTGVFFWSCWLWNRNQFYLCQNYSRQFVKVYWMVNEMFVADANPTTQGEHCSKEEPRAGVTMLLVERGWCLDLRVGTKTWNKQVDIFGTEFDIHLWKDIWFVVCMNIITKMSHDLIFPRFSHWVLRLPEAKLLKPCKGDESK